MRMLSLPIDISRRLIASGPNIAVILLIAWASISFILTAPDLGRGRDIAFVELMRLSCGAMIYFAAFLFFNSRNKLCLAALILLISCSTVSLTSLIGFTPGPGKYMAAAFGDNQILGAFLTGFLPLTAALALTESKVQRMLAFGAMILVACALLVTGNRSGYIGAGVGLIVTGWLAQRAGIRPVTAILCAIREKRTRYVVSAALVFLFSYLGLTGAGTTVLERARTFANLSEDGSVATRLQTWRISANMVLARPLMGSGVGSFPLRFGDSYRVMGGNQSHYRVPSAAQVVKEGVTLSSIAHNEYLQLATELGLVGLALYIAVLVLFFKHGVQAMCQMSNGTPRWLLLATLGAVAAQTVDAFANPGWRFIDVSPLLWLFLGLGMATARWNYRDTPKLRAPSGYSSQLLGPMGRLLSAALMVAITTVLYMGNVHGSNGLPVPQYIGVDANRDNRIVFDDTSDQTTAAKPFRFWLNNDRDLDGVFDPGEQDDADPREGPPDSNDLIIASDRDLEDFTRLHIRAPSDYDPDRWRVTLRFTTGLPVINVWGATEPGTRYLTDRDTAARQRIVSFRAKVDSLSEVAVPKELFVNSDKTAHLIFEGRAVGKGTLTVRFYDRLGQRVAEDQVYVDLKDIKGMYDHFSVGDSHNVDVRAISPIANLIHMAEDRAERPGYILFVHGWRLQGWERRAFAETAFKRLWHRGYKGAFGLFSWPTEWNPGTYWSHVSDPINYDRSEQKAFVSARGLAGLLVHLYGQYPGQVRVIAHSMGNVVVGEALRQYVETNPSHPIVHTYIATQAAVPAHAYDATAPTIISQRRQRYPNVYAAYPVGFSFPYFGTVFAAVNNKMSNYYNEQDYALDKYTLNQEFKPVNSRLAASFGITYQYTTNAYNQRPSGFYRISSLGGGPELLRFPEDRYEIFAFAAPSWSKALGEQENIRGPFTELVDLQAEFSFGSTPTGHSAQFRSTFRRRYPYWDRVLTTFGLR